VQDAIKHISVTKQLSEYLFSLIFRSLTTLFQLQMLYSVE